MNTHYNLNDLEFEEQFKTGVFNAALFDHEAHLRLAWLQINRYGVAKAEEHIHNQLLAFVKLLGAGHKYNKTLTIAGIKTVYHFMLRSESDTFKDFILEFPRLKHNFKDLMNTHYGFDIFNSEKAKIEYQEPDLLPFD
ncbi:hypothetical protein [uncultured Maribacter sp.]|uniref:hypothetical protein n=1 Tax=uncultured Maribacter sp. TaxID=431308 RepID=UPI0030D8790E|tara:strand:+ start:123 stop:536 length:414 start_codon:yes stop_codon:yes gene_type:complete